MVAIQSGRSIWPSSGDLETTIVNTHGNIVLGLCPHPNEPMGILLVEYLCNELGKSLHSIIWNIDPPINDENKFSIQENFHSFLSQFHLPEFNNQVEFSYSSELENNLVTSSQKRASEIFNILGSIRDVNFLMLHNDPFGSQFYCYLCGVEKEISRLHKTAEKFAYDLNLKYKLREKLPKVSWTKKNNNKSYQYFQAKKISPLIQTESAGIFLNHKGIPTASLEIPMFNWSSVNYSLKAKAQFLFSTIQEGQLDLVQRKKLFNKANNEFLKIQFNKF
jgi:hypothetical protein